MNINNYYSFVLLHVRINSMNLVYFHFFFSNWFFSLRFHLKMIDYFLFYFFTIFWMKFISTKSFQNKSNKSSIFFKSKFLNHDYKILSILNFLTVNTNKTFLFFKFYTYYTYNHNNLFLFSQKKYIWYNIRL